MREWLARHGVRRDRRPRRRRRHLPPAPPSTPGCSPGPPARSTSPPTASTSRLLGEVEDEVVDGVPRRRRRAVRPLPPLPAADGRVERAALRAHAAGPGRAAAARWRRAARGGHRRGRRRLRQRPRPQPAGRGLPGQPLHRLRHVRERRSPGPARTRRPRRSATSRFVVRDAAALDERERVRRRHDLRRHPRPGPPRHRAGRHPPGPAAGRHLPVRGAEGLEPPARERRPAAGADAVHGVHHALHDRVAGLRRRGPRRGMGRAGGPRSGWPRPASSTSSSTGDPRRPRQQLLPGPRP